VLYRSVFRSSNALLWSTVSHARCTDVYIEKCTLSRAFPWKITMCSEPGSSPGVTYWSFFGYDSGRVLRIQLCLLVCVVKLGPVQYMSFA